MPANELKASRPSTPMAQSQLKLAKKLAAEDLGHSDSRMRVCMHAWDVGLTLWK